MSNTPNYKQYVELRTILDSLQIGALRFYLNAPDQTQQDLNFKYIKEKTKPILDHIWGKSNPRAVECPEGYHDCDGCCVPYTCLGGGSFPKKP